MTSLNEYVNQRNFTTKSHLSFKLISAIVWKNDGGDAIEKGVRKTIMEPFLSHSTNF